MGILIGNWFLVFQKINITEVGKMLYLKKREIQIYEWLKSRSVNGKFNIKDFTMRKLAEELGMGLSTLYANLNGLCDKGLVEWLMCDGTLRIRK